MTAAVGTLLTVNAGSSSVKLAVFGPAAHTEELQRLLDVSLENIGAPISKLRIMPAASPAQVEEVHAPNYAQASDIVMEKLAGALPASPIVAIGHRFVHGGSTFTSATPVTTISEEDWQVLSQLDPHHTPAARQLVARCAERCPGALQVACFDTAFFHELPHAAKIIPIPQKYYNMGVRRYGFHGLSYTSLLAVFRETAGEVAANGRVIFAHLGSGASLAATRHGKPVDTTMSFTPASGIPMSTRSGDLDPAIFSFLQHQTTMSADEFTHMVNFESGLRGVSGITGDMQTLLDLETQNNAAALAVELFVRNVKKSIGALASVLGGVDSLVFSGGIGEQSAELRTRFCHRLAYLGIELDDTANQQNAFLISAEHSKVGVHVIASNEAQVIARQTSEVLQKMNKDDAWN